MEEITKSYTSVLVVDQSQSHKGILTNAALVIGLSAGRRLPDDTFGRRLLDGDGQEHESLTTIAHFVRKASQSKIRSLRETIAKDERSIVIDYTEDAAPSDYEIYAENLKSHAGEKILYRALYIYGPYENVYPLTKNLPRLE